MTTQAQRAAEIAAQVNGALKQDVMFLGNDPKYSTKLLPTGVLPVDILLQGGFARGRMTGISGTWSSLKTLIALRACGAAQARGEVAAFVDVERTFDREWAASAGVDTTSLLYTRPKSGEAAFDQLELLIRSGVDIVIIDSVAALLPQSEREKGMEGERMQPGRLAALMSAGLRKVTAANDTTSIVWLNQTRMQIGITFGNPEQPAGGKALPFYLSQHLVMRKTGKVTEPARMWDGEKWKTEGKVQIAQKFSASLEKSKLNRPQREVNFAWDYRSAEIDLPGFLIGQGLELGLIDVKGNTWSVNGVKAVGRQKFADMVAADNDMMSGLEAMVRQAHDLPVLTSPGPLPRPSKQADAPRPVKRARSARASTPAAAADASASTPAPKRRSTSSSKRVRRSA